MRFYYIFAENLRLIYVSPLPGPVPLANYTRARVELEVPKLELHLLRGKHALCTRQDSTHTYGSRASVPRRLHAEGQGYSEYRASGSRARRHPSS